MQDDPTTRPWADTHDPGQDHPVAVCPFLRSLDDRALLGLPVGSPDPLNRCAALREPVPQSLRQQELVCLTSGHVNCPRFMRGAPDLVQTPEPVVAISLTTPAIAGSLLVLAASFILSIVFVMNNGGLVLTAAAPSSAPTGVVLGDVEGATPAPSGPVGVTASGSIVPASSPTPNPTVSPTSTPPPSPSPTADGSASPMPSPTSKPTAKPTKKPSSDRYALLTPCPDQAKCYIYVIRSGDNLFSIAHYFGVPLATVKSMNPWTATGLRSGRELRIPPPTR